MAARGVTWGNAVERESVLALQAPTSALKRPFGLSREHALNTRKSRPHHDGEGGAFVALPGSPGGRWLYPAGGLEGVGVMVGVNIQFDGGVQ